MRIREKPLEPWVIIKKDEGIESSHCTCMAGMGECCSHVGAVLFAMEQSTKARDDTTVTDVPAYWLYPSKAKFDVPFKSLRDMDFQSAAKKRKLDDRSTEHNIPSTAIDRIPLPTIDEENEFYDELHKVLPKSPILSLTDTFSGDFKPKTSHQYMPKEIKKHFNVGSDINITYEEMVKRCEEVTIDISTDNVRFVERQTRQQAESSIWFRQSCGRITSSIFHTVCHTTFEKPSMSLFKKIANTNVKVICAATEWGKKNEKNARELYSKKAELQHNNFKINESGLHLSAKYYQIAASPDGMTECCCCGRGCIEIKCPYSLRDKHRLDVNWICVVDNERCLDRTHSYYFQIQMQLFVTERQFCDFIVWWPHGVYVERIYVDKNFMEKI